MDLPTSELNLFEDEVLREPWHSYQRLRCQGPAVWMNHGQYVAVSHYEAARAVLSDSNTFISGEGAGLIDTVNQAMKGTILASDGKEHETLRGILSERLSPRALRKLTADVQAQADLLIGSLVSALTFNAVTDLAQRFPLTVVVELIGLPQEGREKILEYAKNTFDAFGPATSIRAVKAAATFGEIFEYAFRVTRRDRLREGSMGAALLDAVDAGTISAEKAGVLMVAYLTGGLDTTIASICHAMVLFSDHPGEWDKVRSDPSLIPAAYNEVLRLQAPVHWFSRLAIRDTTIGDADVRAGTRIVVLYAAANRDERKWDKPDAFDVTRNAADHLAFGYGAHGCAGQALARLEVHSLLRSMAKLVERFEVGERQPAINNVVHSYSHLGTRLHPAPAGSPA